MTTISPYIIPPVLCLLTGYYLAAVSLIWGKFRRDSIYLSLICFWWTLLSYAFIYHHIETDPDRIMKFERIIHSLFVFNPVISVLYFQALTGKIRKLFLALCLFVSLIFLFTVHTPYYFDGFYYYKWGMIAKGGTAFRMFSLWGIFIIFYILFTCIIKIISERNRVSRLKYYYIVAAFFISVCFKFSNIPAMNGVDFYPLSNLEFIPLSILTYGIIKYRLIVFTGVLPQAMSWVVFSAMVAAPNMFIFLLLRDNFSRLGTLPLIIILLVWYFANYYYSVKIQPIINQIFNRRNYNLSRMQREFIDDIATLKNLDELVKIMISMLKRALHIENASLYIRRGYAGSFIDSRGNILDLNAEAAQMLLSGEIFERSLVESELESDLNAKEVMPLFDKLNSEYIIALVHNSEMIALLSMMKKTDTGRLWHNEISFIHSLSSYATIALANSVMYQNLTDIKINLEQIVEERTAVIEKQKSDMENDIELARRIQNSLLPDAVPVIKNLAIAYRYEPIMAVGGDFIDIHYREGMNEAGLFICDVSGHGASSAMIAAMVKMSLNSWGEYIKNPGSTFCEIGNLLKGKIGDNFITAYMCFVNVETGEITSICAGHPPMLVIRESGSVEKIKPSGMIIIDLADGKYDVSKNRLYRGDKIVLYTDGVFEARYETDDIIGEERFIHMLTENRTLTVNELCEKIYSEIFSHSGNLIEDDFALLIAEYKG